MIRRYYEILQVSEDATPEQIEKAYKRAASRTHPDKNIGNEAQAAEEFKHVKEAYECLIDPERRESYDRNGDTGVNLGDPVSELFVHLFNEIIDQYGTVDGLLKRMRSIINDLIGETNNKRKQIETLIESTNRMITKVQYTGKDMNLIEGLLQERLKGLEKSLKELQEASTAALGVQDQLKSYQAMDREPRDPHRDLARQASDELWRSLRGRDFRPFT